MSKYEYPTDMDMVAFYFQFAYMPYEEVVRMEFFQNFTEERKIEFLENLGMFRDFYLDFTKQMN